MQAALAANLRRLRIARYISLSELARVTGISKATLSGIENAHANPTVETIARALRVSLVELLEAMPADKIRVVRATQSQPAQQDRSPRRLLDEIAPGGPLELSEMRLAGGQAHKRDA